MGQEDVTTALGGRECVAKTVMVRASSEADVTKFVRGCWLGQRSVQSRKGKQRVLDGKVAMGSLTVNGNISVAKMQSCYSMFVRRLLHAAAQLHRRPTLLLSFLGVL